MVSAGVVCSTTEMAEEFPAIRVVESSEDAIRQTDTTAVTRSRQLVCMLASLHVGRWKHRHASEKSKRKRELTDEEQPQTRPESASVDELSHTSTSDSGSDGE
jgi:hypothetical protein